MTVAALAVTLALMQAANSAPLEGGDQSSRFNSCVALIDQDPARAYEEGMAWAGEAHQLGGYRCAAMAKVAQNPRSEEGARRLEGLATTVQSNGLQAELFSQAGNAWLLAHEPSRARSSFTRAITALGEDPAQLPDLLIDRARAYAMEADYRHAEEDLSRALDLRPNDTLVLRLRASARMHQSVFDLAEADALASLSAARTDDDRVGAALILGHVRESRRTGHPVDEQ